MKSTQAPIRKAPLTPSEAKAYKAFAELSIASPVAVSMADVANKIGKHVSSVCRLLNSCVTKGWLEKEPNKYRSLRLAA